MSTPTLAMTTSSSMRVKRQGGRVVRTEGSLSLRTRESISVTNEVRVELYHQAQYNQCVTIIDLRALKIRPIQWDQDRVDRESHLELRLSLNK